MANSLRFILLGFGFLPDFHPPAQICASLYQSLLISKLYCLLQICNPFSIENGILTNYPLCCRQRECLKKNLVPSSFLTLTMIVGYALGNSCHRSLEAIFQQRVNIYHIVKSKCSYYIFFHPKELISGYAPGKQPEINSFWDGRSTTY